MEITKDTVALVTGANGGIGTRFVHDALRQGSNLLSNEIRLDIRQRREQRRLSAGWIQ